MTPRDVSSLSYANQIRELWQDFWDLSIEQQLSIFRGYFQEVFDQRDALETRALQREAIFLQNIEPDITHLASALEEWILSKVEAVFASIENLAIGKDQIQSPQINFLWELLSPLVERLASVIAFKDINSDLLEKYVENDFKVNRKDEWAEEQLEEVRRDLCGYVLLLQSISNSLGRVVSDGERILSSSQLYFEQMKSRYWRRDDNSIDWKSLAPIVNNDIKFTAFLEDFVRDLPTPELKEESEEKEVSELRVEDFNFSWYRLERCAKLLFDCSQEWIQSLIQVKYDAFEWISHMFGAVVGVFAKIQKICSEHRIDSILAFDPKEVRSSSIKFDEIIVWLLEKNKNYGREASRIVDEISEVNLAKIKLPKKEDTTDYNKDQKEYREALGEIFTLVVDKIKFLQKHLEKLWLWEEGLVESNIRRVMQSNAIRDTLQELEEFIKELSVLKYKMDHLGTLWKRKRKKIEKDGEKDNHCYSVGTGSGGIFWWQGGLELQRVPTHDVAYQDIIGASWRKVEQQVNDVLDYAKYQYVHLEMSPRRKMQWNFIVIWPYGCGKNEFMKALMSDERTIWVQTTTDRILSMMFGEFERNVRKLFELSEAKHHEHRKPVIIGWDEFDSMFPDDGIRTSSWNSPYTQAQKILQSVLDGDTPYEGTFLCSVTNEPQKIPVPIYRRFRTVQLIDKLADNERMQLMIHFLNGLPTSPGFNDQVDWDYFKRKTDNASGEILGKIADKVFKNYLTDFENKRPQRLLNINSQIQEMVEKWEKLTPEKRRKIFSKDGSPLVTPIMFMNAINDVMWEDAVVHQLDQQLKFYEWVEELLQRAFQGSI